MNRQRASRLPRRSSIQISNQWNKQAAAATADPLYDGADPKKWFVKTQTFNAKFLGGFNKEEVNGQLIKDGIEKFKKDPIKYAGIMYKTDEMNKPKREQGYALILREKGSQIVPSDVSPDGQFTIMTQEYRRLPPLKNDTLPKLCRDEYTDDMIYKGKKLHMKANKPLMPGRGMGLLDQPNMKLIGTIDPSDVKQGLIADCWLLSGISTLAEFEGGIQRLFRKTKNFQSMPFDDRPNMYTITLWDISTWTEVDIVIDERLCSRPDGQNRRGENKLLGAKPSDDGELWVPYLEKAVSIHCGGWDKISYGANCNHAWAILTGVKEQCTILRVGDETTNWGCYAKYDPYKKDFAELDNDPWKGFQSVYTVPWPDTEGGGFEDFKDTSELTDVQLFGKMCEWDGGNFLMACSSKGLSDREKTDGIVNKHAYGVVECKSNVAGTGLDMIQLRNPWGKGGELENAQFGRDKGPGWKKYPQLKRELKPDQDSPGVFWLTRQEFFKYYDKIYLSAGDMSEFLGLTPPKQKREKPKDEMETDTKKRKVEAPNDKHNAPNASTSPVKKIKPVSPKKKSPIKAKPKGFVKVEKNIPKKGRGKKGATGFFKAIPSSKGGGFKKMIPRNKQEEIAKAKLEREKKEKEKQENERLEQERLEKEKQEKVKLELESQEKERAEKEKQERLRLEREKQAKAKQERDRLERERKATQQLDKQERERLERENKAQEKREKLERDRLERDKEIREKKEKEKLERERKTRERLERERLQWEEKEQDRFEKEMEDKEKQEKQNKAKLGRSARKVDSSNTDSLRGKQSDSMNLQEKDAIIADLQRRLNEAEKETVELRTKTTTLTAIQEDLEDQAMEYEEQLETKSGIIDTLTDELNQAYEEAEPEGNAKELRAKNAELRDKTEEVSSKNAEIAKLKKELAKARGNALSQSDQKASVMQHRREIEEKTAIIASMRKEIDNGKRRISALQDQTSELENTKQELEVHSKGQKRKIEQLERDDGTASSLRADLQKAKKTIQNLSQNKSQSLRDMAKKDKRIDFLRSELREANQAIQSLERKMGGSRDRDRVKLNQLKKALEDKQSELDSKDAKLRSAERVGQEVRKRLREKDDRINSVLNQLQQSRKEVRGLGEKNDMVSKKLKSSEHHVSFLDTQLEEAKHLIQTLEARTRASRDREVARLRKQLESKQQEANAQKHQLQQTMDSAQSSRIALRAKEQESIDLRGALRGLRQEFQSLEQEKNDSYTRENRKLKQIQSRLNTTQAALETERAKRKEADDRVDELEEELRKERNKRQRLNADQTNERTPAKAPEAGQLLQQKEEELNFIGKKLRRMTLHQQQSSRHLAQEMTQKEVQISDLQQQVDDLQRENEALYEKTATQKSLSKKLHDLEIELDKKNSLAETWKEDLESLQDTVDEHKHRIQQMDAEISDKDSLIQLLEQKIAEHVGLIAQKSAASAKHAKIISDLNRKLESAQEQLKRRRIESTNEGSNRDRTDELERELWEARDDSDSLRHTIKLQQAELEEKEALIESLTRRLKEGAREPSLSSEPAQERTLTAERLREPRPVVELSRDQSATAAREPSLRIAELAPAQRSNGLENGPAYHHGDTKTSLELDAERARASEEKHYGYDRHSMKTDVEAEQEIPGSQEVDERGRAKKQLRENERFSSNHNLRHVPEKLTYAHERFPSNHNLLHVPEKENLDEQFLGNSNLSHSSGKERFDDERLPSNPNLRHVPVNEVFDDERLPSNPNLRHVPMNEGFDDERLPSNPNLRHVPVNEGCDHERLPSNANLRHVPEKDHFLHDRLPHNPHLRHVSENERYDDEQLPSIPHLRHVSENERYNDEQLPSSHNLRDVPEKQDSDYGGLPGNPNLRHVSETESVDHKRLQSNLRHVSEKENFLLDRLPSNRHLSDKETFGNGGRAYSHLHVPDILDYESRTYASHVSERESYDNDERGYSHVRAPDVTNYESRAKSDPPAGGAKTESARRADPELVAAPTHLKRTEFLPLQAEDENRSRRGGFDEPEGEKWDEDEFSSDMSNSRNEVEENDFMQSTTDEHEWNEKPDFHASQLRDQSRTKHSDFDESIVADNAQTDINKGEPWYESLTMRRDFDEASGMNEEKRNDASYIRTRDNGRRRNRDFDETSDIHEDKWIDEPHMKALHTRNKGGMKGGDFDKAKPMGDEEWSEEHAKYSKPRDSRRTRHGDYDEYRVLEGGEWNEEPTMASSSLVQDRRMRQHRDFDEPMDMSDEKWREESDLQPSRSTDERNGMRRDHKEPLIMEDGKWNEELGIYVKPTPASRRHQEIESNPYMARSGSIDVYGQRDQTDSLPKDHSPWYFDSHPPIGNWNEGWDSNLRRQPEDHQARREDHGARRLNARDDTARGAQLSGYGDADSDQYTSNAHVVGSMNSWAESNGSRQQERLPSQRSQGKQDEAPDSINDYLARLFEKVQATKSELEATQKRLNHNVGRHLVHE